RPGRFVLVRRIISCLHDSFPATVISKKGSSCTSGLQFMPASCVACIIARDSTATRELAMESTLSHGCSGACSIIPLKLLEYLARDERLSTAERRIFFDTAQFERRWRKARAAETRLTLAAQAKLPSALTAAPSDLPAVAVFDCRHGTKLPGTPVPDPNQTEDAAARQAFVETTAVAEFYKTLFGRNSIDNAGIAIISSVHYSVKYNNAFWNGNQMVYGDGDGNIFLNFTKSDDVIGHELTHGVTQHSLGLSYVNQAGGLNESISDVFGAMFRQWRAGLDVTSASWLIGS